MMEVYDFMMEYCVDASMCDVELFDNEEGEVIFSGRFDDMPEEYHDYTIESFDPIYKGVEKLTLNVSK